MKRLFWLFVLVPLVFVSCSKPEPPPPPKPAQKERPKKSTDQIYNEVMRKLNPLIGPGQMNQAGPVAQVINDAKKSPEPNNKPAFNRVKGTLSERLVQANKSAEWNAVMTICGGLQALAEDDNDRQKIQRYRSRAQAELNKPRVTVKGFFTEGASGTVSVFLDVFLPSVGRSESVQVREGDEFIENPGWLTDPENESPHLLRLERIIGDNKAIRIHYMKTDSTWDVMAH